MGDGRQQSAKIVREFVKNLLAHDTLGACDMQLVGSFFALSYVILSNSLRGFSSLIISISIIFIYATTIDVATK